MLQSWLGEVVKAERIAQGINLPTKVYKLEESINDESRDGYWKQTTKFVSLRYSSNTWRTLACEVVVNHKTGLSGPCVLLCSDDGCTLTVAMVNDGNCNYGEIPATMIPSNGVYHIRDGPSVLWCNHNGLAMLSTSDTNKMILNCFTPEELFDINTTSGLECALDRIWVLSGRQEVDSLRVFIRANLSVPGDLNPPKKLKPVEPDVLWCTATIRQQDGSPGVTKLPDNLYIHSDYAPVINCVMDYDNCDPYVLGDPHQLSQYVVGTMYQQMLIFENGKVLHCTSLECVPFRILVCQLGASDAFIVQDKTANVFVYTLNKTGFVLQRSWAGVFAVLIDDFVFNGNDQLLVIMDDPNSDEFSLSNFILTDLGTIEIPSPQDDMDEDQRSDSESMNNAVTALQKRLMHEKKVLDELQLEHSQKKQLLDKATELLNCLDKGSSYEWAPDQALVPLLEPVSGHDVLSTTLHPTGLDRGSLDVVSTWQRIMDTQWIVGIVVVNNTSSPITEVGATVTCTAHTEVAETKCVMFPDQPAVGGSLPIMGWTDSQLGCGQTANMVCATGLPVFASDKIIVGLLLCWRDTRDDDKVHTRYAGHVQLTVGEVYNTSLCCNPVTDWCNPITEHTRQDQMTYLVTHQITELEFKSLFTDLRKLPDMLKTCLPSSNHVIISADSAMSTTAPVSPTHISTSVVIIPTTTERKYASIKVLYKESSRYSVLLQLLKGSLASDVNVQSIDCGWRETILRCHQLLQRHVEHLIAITDEQLQTGRVPTENEIYDHKVDMAMKNVMELVEN